MDFFDEVTGVLVLPNQTPSGVGMRWLFLCGHITIRPTSPCCADNMLYARSTGPDLVCIGCNQVFTEFNLIPSELLLHSGEYKQVVHWPTDSISVLDKHEMTTYIELWTKLKDVDLQLKGFK